MARNKEMIRVSDGPGQPIDPIEAVCNLCHETVPGGAEAQAVHILLFHPRVLLTHPGFVRAATGLAYELGERFAEMFRRM